MAYVKLSDAERQESDEQHYEDQEKRFERHECRYRLGTLVTLWLLSLGVACGVTRWYYVSTCTNIETVAAVDYNSPLYGRLNPRLVDATPERSLWDDGSSIYRHEPSPEADAAWEALVRWNPILISEDDMAHLDLPTKGAVKWPGDQSGRSYVARMDIFHLLHCVNELRKGNWFNYYQRNETLNPAYYNHKKHCLDIIRQEIMCTGSMNVYRLVWSDHQKRPWPEFTIHRKCRNFDDIMDWYESHRMSDEDFEQLPKMEKPEGEFAVPMPPEGVQIVEAVDVWQKKWGIEDWND
ncbi:Hypothetical predicted protein [Lecanosticta acicola]|uniref:Tat pathway signal sequence n=1 Tax=Lecanosticta acicola TaxID=111012 RepID=A0AAI8YWV2_9PEZI|nr:Hypothetical predicted protein [Lecanosticta acicola]